ncbi:MAG: Asp23/Gls24 family envelope stress response protein [Acidimicrobiales bacterium]
MSDPSSHDPSHAPTADIRPGGPAGPPGVAARPAASQAVQHHPGSGPGVPSAGARLQTERGTTRIADTVVAKIAAMSTREIPGVQAMGKSMARAFGTMRSRIPGGASNTATQGIAVEVGERQAAIDIDIVVHYGQSLVEVTQAVRANVIDRLETMTGLEVVEVNISVDDLYLESEPGEELPQPVRVQ